MKRISTLNILVENNAGILTRISQVFSRRGYNIESINAAVNGNENQTRIIATISEEESLVRQVINQIEKLEDVINLEIMDQESFISREMLIVRLKIHSKDYLEINALTNLYKANIIDYSSEDLFIELTGDRKKLDDFLKILEKYEIKDVTRTGITGIKRK
ncbi:acetolactate synthase small subunit [Anaerococcus hydrogenalis]|uniref:Acetolactate synthase small subunit n=1 Tax=Anaerococcus hydrogenalis TaxID=33029 RepID=A0A2N6UHZ7_9FIRM|nr:acetolactate synthase small subunit [Anaerococcus hydrogenalis]MDK7695380.1 acetolactate synthase small subunit [Anaerococcus hydrogenalis]MDK7697139.1 acetolactate synthase small subunit [Anaerococcus hydrogenalis]MDK7708340.1 acetolactate synthase small subunit [Anaerococcus hydrogenalis]PMC81164.1 acetolactate synthase small subunit [Anaerococcus hydrogenalis]